jgi:hypothetical protein
MVEQAVAAGRSAAVSYLTIVGCLLFAACSGPSMPVMDVSPHAAGTAEQLLQHTDRLKHRSERLSRFDRGHTDLIAPTVAEIKACTGLRPQRWCTSPPLVSGVAS